MNWQIEEKARNLHELTFMGEARKRREHKVLLTSDDHWDNALCDRGTLAAHHKEAVDTGSPILKFGDIFCLMQGKWDKRANPNEIRPEHRIAYRDSVISTAVDWYGPYAKNIALVTPGNHETEFNRRHETDITTSFASCLKLKYGSPTCVGAFCGYVRFLIPRPHCGSGFVSVDLFYHHGYGGGGEVTRGMIDNSRTRGQYVADIYYSGHIHRRNCDENTVCGLSQKGVLTTRRQWFLRGSSYKLEGADGNGYHVEKGRGPRPIGGWWIKLRTYRTGNNDPWKVEVTLIPA